MEIWKATAPADFMVIVFMDAISLDGTKDRVFIAILLPSFRPKSGVKLSHEQACSD